jgi:diguanylate cyclase (GGDEF)-like protein/PAS domain S-box-containing protein
MPSSLPTDLSISGLEQEAIEKLAAIVTGSDDAIIGKDMHGVITSWNRGAQIIFGYTPEEAIGQHIEFLIPPERREEQDFISNKIRNGERVTHFETERLGKKGRVSVSVTVSPIFNVNGNVIGASKIARDITQQKKMQESLLDANKELAFQIEEKNKLVAELVIANEEKSLRAVELERQARELELNQENLRLLNAAIHHANDIVVITDVNYESAGPHIVYVNDAFVKETGYSLQEVIGKNLTILHGPKTDLSTSGRIRAALKKWQPILIDVLNYKKNGKEFWQELNIFPVSNADGLYTHWVAIQRNITERKLSEQVLIDVKERLALALRAGSVGVWDWDIDNNVLVWDDMLYELHGVSKDQFSGAYEAWNQCLHPEDREQTELNVKNALAGSQDYNCVYRVVWPDGSIRFIHGLGTVERDSNGKPISMRGTNWDVTQQKIAEKKAEQLALFDHLTSLANRRLFSERLVKARERSIHSKQYCALLAIDIDYFKTINDLHGHDIGDLVLKRAGECFLKAVRAGDTVARLGGDEFMVLLEDLGSDHLEASSASKIFAEKIVDLYGSSAEFPLPIPTSSLSIGVFTFLGQHELSDDELMKRSDLALYQAKQSGRNSIQFYDAEMHALLNARTDLIKVLNQAIQNEWLTLYFQPQINGNGQIYSAEVLVRINHPQNGLIVPSDFIEIAESTGLIVPIGQWVFNAVCAQLASWASQPNMAHLKLSVNISINQFLQPNFVSDIIGAVVRTGVNPRLLTLELTETLFLEDKLDAISKMQALKSYGFNFSLDDFGIGYSSLSYLGNLEFDELKIDKAFIAEVPGNQTSCDIIKIIVLMGTTLGLTVIAEGVESQDQVRFLRSIGCDHYQGYLFFRPMPLDQFVEILAN